MLNESITQLEHALQAAYIASKAGAPEDVTIGLLLHDVGQIATAEHVGDAEYLHRHHDNIGTKWAIDYGFPEVVAEIIGNHTMMKVILLENLKRIGSIGEVIEVKRGFARNFLIANKKALYASKENIKDRKAIIVVKAV